MVESSKSLDANYGSTSRIRPALPPRHLRSHQGLTSSNGTPAPAVQFCRVPLAYAVPDRLTCGVQQKQVVRACRLVQGVAPALCVGKVLVVREKLLLYFCSFHTLHGLVCSRRCYFFRTTSNQYGNFDTPTAKAASSPFGMSGILKCLCERSPFLFCSSLQMRVCHHPS